MHTCDSDLGFLLLIHTQFQFLLNVNNGRHEILGVAYLLAIGLSLTNHIILHFLDSFITLRLQMSLILFVDIPQRVSLFNMCKREIEVQYTVLKYGGLHCLQKNKSMIFG